MTDSRFKHFLKTISWRIVGSLDTWILATFVTQSTQKGSYIALLEVISKMILYYIHERVWLRIPFGISNGIAQNHRFIVKAFSWRAIGTLDTMFLAWIISGSALNGLKIGVFELITKMILYFIHEKIWHHIKL